MLKFSTVLFFICLSVHLSTQVNYDDWFAQRLIQKFEELEGDLIHHNPNPIPEFNKIICSCDNGQSEKCLPPPSILHRLTRSIEKPITAIFEAIRKSSGLGSKKTESQVKSEATCSLQTVIRCENPTDRIKIIRAELNNQNKNSCPALGQKTNGKTCAERIKSTTITSKLCDDKNECKLAIDTDLSGLCECAPQKYLNLTYTCLGQKKPEEQNKDDAQPVKRNKRLIRLHFGENGEVGGEGLPGPRRGRPGPEHERRGPRHRRPHHRPRESEHESEVEIEREIERNGELIPPFYDDLFYDDLYNYGAYGLGYGYGYGYDALYDGYGLGGYGLGGYGLGGGLGLGVFQPPILFGGRMRLSYGNRFRKDEEESESRGLEGPPRRRRRERRERSEERRGAEEERREPEEERIRGPEEEPREPEN